MISKTLGLPRLQKLLEPGDCQAKVLWGEAVAAAGQPHGGGVPQSFQHTPGVEMALPTTKALWWTLTSNVNPHDIHVRPTGIPRMLHWSKPHQNAQRHNE